MGYGSLPALRGATSISMSPWGSLVHCTECSCPQEGSPEQPRCQAGHHGAVVVEVTAGAGLGLGTSWWHLVTPMQWEPKAGTSGLALLGSWAPAGGWD